MSESLVAMARNIGAAYGVPVIDLSGISAVEAEYEMRAWRTDGVGYREVLYRDRCHEGLVTSLLWDPAW